MPFAKKFRAMVDFPSAGDVLDGFMVESVDVRDVQGGSMGYIYGVRMVLQGPGGQAGVRKALKDLFASHPVTFSGYGNPYQLWFRKPALVIESLGNTRYAVRIEGAGIRVYIEDELIRFLEYLEQADAGIPHNDASTRAALVEGYLQEYKTVIARKVDSYYRKLRARKVGQ